MLNKRVGEAFDIPFNPKEGIRLMNRACTGSGPGLGQKISCDNLAKIYKRGAEALGISKNLILNLMLNFFRKRYWKNFGLRAKSVFNDLSWNGRSRHEKYAQSWTAYFLIYFFLLFSFKFLTRFLCRMEEFILGKGAARQEPEEVRVEGGDAVRELKRSMLEGTKVDCYSSNSTNILC
jgi:hypothetical protein